jgi:hypothetical protein
MHENNKIHLLLALILIILLCVTKYVHQTYFNDDDLFEHMVSNEAINSVASIFNTGTMTVGNIVATGTCSAAGDTSLGSNLSVTKNGKLGGDVTIGGNTIIGKDLTVGANKWKISNADTKTLSFIPNGDSNNGVSFDSSSGIITSNSIVVKNLTASTLAQIKVPVFIVSKEINAALNVFDDTVSYMQNDDRLKWYVEYHDDYGDPANKTWTNGGVIKGKYMSFKNLSNGQYLGSVSGTKGDKIVTISTITDRSMWQWMGTYLCPKNNKALRINIHRTINIKDNPKVILWDNRWKDWENEFMLVPAIF